MSFIIENSSTSFERCPEGNHLARCYRIVDLGSQKKEYMGELKIQRQLTIGWEVHAVSDDGTPLLMKDGRPYAVFKNYTHSWSENANLRKDLQSWRGKAFTDKELQRIDLSTILGKWCMLNVIERPGKKGGVFSNVDSINPVPAVIKQGGLPEPVNLLEMFNLDKPDMKVFEGLSNSLKEKIMQSPQWQKIKGTHKPSFEDESEFDTVPDDDSIPF